MKFGDFRTLYEVFYRSVKQHVRCPHIGHWLPDKNRWKGDQQDLGERLGYRKRSSMRLMSFKPFGMQRICRAFPRHFFSLSSKWSPRILQNCWSSCHITSLLVLFSSCDAVQCLLLCLSRPFRQLSKAYVSVQPILFFTGSWPSHSRWLWDYRVGTKDDEMMTSAETVEERQVKRKQPSTEKSGKEVVRLSGVTEHISWDINNASRRSDRKTEHFVQSLQRNTIDQME